MNPDSQPGVDQLAQPQATAPENVQVEPYSAREVKTCKELLEYRIHAEMRRLIDEFESETGAKVTDLNYRPYTSALLPLGVSVMFDGQYIF